MSKARKVQIAWFNVTYYAGKDQKGEVTQEEDWEIDSYQDIDQTMSKYIAACNEHEDQELSDLEVKRLQDFVLYLKVQ